MKHGKLLGKMVVASALVCAFFSPISMTKVSAAEYAVEFKAGAHGTVNGEKSVSYLVNSGDVFPNEPSINVESGYVFKGWNKELPEVGSAVEGKQIYVAKYGVVINGLNYTVRYVDENSVDIATPTTMLGEDGEQYTVRAKTVAGYTYQNPSQTFTLDENNKQILIVYTLTNPNIVNREEIIYENEVVNQVVPAPNTTVNTPVNTPATPGTTPGDTPGTDNNAGEDQENPNIEIPENQQPEAGGNEVEIPSNEQPLAKGSTDNNDNLMLYGAIGGAVILLGAFAIFVAKRKQNKEAVDNK